jgi:hypothetical protein
LSIAHCQPFNIGSFCPLILIDSGTFLILGKLFLCGCFVSIDLPAAYALANAGSVFHKAAYILRRITQKKTDLMGKLRFTANLSGKLADTFFAVACAVSLAVKNLGRRGIGQIRGEFSGAVYIDQRFILCKAKRKNTQSLLNQFSVGLPNKGKEIFSVPVRAGK